SPATRYGNKDNIIGYANDAVAYTQPVKKFKSLIKQRYRWKYGRFIAFVKYHNLFSTWIKSLVRC
ncbi:hypothetical protein, partial [Lacticaseibacillus rhamnosus]|uniref:hypothetical protein n=1 Tax=Lacticaseibacillus rhamnosus TaxID=47715 RepID=UPI001CDB0ABB